MKYFIIILLIINFDQPIFSQSIGANGVRSDSRINDLFEDLKNKVKKPSNKNFKIVGSPYFNVSFELAEIEYFGKDLNEKI